MQGSQLRRERHPMPSDVQEALVQYGLLAAYRSRPPYQQNDYLGWITRAKQAGTRTKRINQMLDELARGDRYMKMVYRPKPGGTRKLLPGVQGAEHSGEIDVP